MAPLGEHLSDPRLHYVILAVRIRDILQLSGQEWLFECVCIHTIEIENEKEKYIHMVVRYFAYTRDIFFWEDDSSIKKEFPS